MASTATAKWLLVAVVAVLLARNVRDAFVVVGFVAINLQFFANRLRKMSEFLVLFMMDFLPVTMVVATRSKNLSAFQVRGQILSATCVR